MALTIVASKTPPGNLSVSHVELHALGERQIGSVVHCSRRASHVTFPRIRASLAPEARFFLAPEGATNLRAGRADIDVRNTAVRPTHGEEALGLAHIQRKNRRGEA